MRETIPMVYHRLSEGESVHSKLKTWERVGKGDEDGCQIETTRTTNVESEKEKCSE